MTSMDFLEMPMNPCSLESIPIPVELPDKSQVWPVMLACYELQTDGTRQGRLDLFPIKVPDLLHSHGTSMPLRFGSPIVPQLIDERNQTTTSSLSGILDGKWIRASPNNNATSDSLDPLYYYAAAHSTGHISIYALSISDEDPTINPMKLQRVASTEGIMEDPTEDPHPLCLSLSWENGVQFPTDSSSSPIQIVSSYSNGTVKIHDVLRKHTSSSSSSSELLLVERQSWVAHTLFTVPAEVWAAAFVGPYSTETSENHGANTAVMTGGDDGHLKLWDTRSTTRPMQVLKHFDAGVTVVSPHPRNEHLVACGSYDETICLYDVRMLSAKSKPLGKSAPLGGGIWRIKWHPVDDDRVLVAAMHGGCRVVKVEELIDDQSHHRVLTATTEFTQHKSMAYGADWLVCGHPTREGYFEAAASCSFYDKAVYLWDTVAV